MSLLTNLSAYYKLDSNANDSVGSNNGTATNMTWVTGQFGNAGSFNGAGTGNSPSSYIVVPSNSVFDGSTGTISFWIKSSKTTFNPFLCRNNNTQDHWFIKTGWTTGGRLATYNGSAVVNSTISVCDGNWHYCTITSSAANGVKIYIDGALNTTAGGNMFLRSSSNSDINFGFRSYDPGATFSGLLDEVGIWMGREFTLADHQEAMIKTYPFSSGPTPNTRNFFTLLSQ